MLEDIMRQQVAVPSESTPRALGTPLPPNPLQRLVLFQVVYRDQLQKSIALLCAHLTGFAWINATASMQCVLTAMAYPETRENIATVAESPPLGYLTAAVALSAAVISNLIMRGLYKIFDKVRFWVSTLDDGTVDVFEALWNKGTKETESDAMGLAVSFLIVQVCRYIISGVLPNEEGVAEAEGLQYSYFQAGALFLCGLGMYFLYAIILLLRVLPHHEMESLQAIMSMVFAWCCLFGGQWMEFVAEPGDIENHYKTCSSVGLTMILQILAYGAIFVVDKIADKLKGSPPDSTPKLVETALRNFIKAWGFLIGFAWEKCFDRAVVSVSHEQTLMDKPIFELIMAVLICVCVLPAWKAYILPKMEVLSLDQSIKDAFKELGYAEPDSDAENEEPKE